MNKDKELLEELALKTMFKISEGEMPGFIDEYHVFLKHVEVLEQIDTTGVEPMAYPYEIETSFLREDEGNCVIETKEALKNTKTVLQNQIKVPKVVG